MFYMDHFVIDWEKVQTVDDLKRLIAAMQISFEPNDPNLSTVQDLVKRERKPGY